MLNLSKNLKQMKESQYLQDSDIYGEMEEGVKNREKEGEWETFKH